MQAATEDVATRRGRQYKSLSKQAFILVKWLQKHTTSKAIRRQSRAAYLPFLAGFSGADFAGVGALELLSSICERIALAACAASAA